MVFQSGGQIVEFNFADQVLLQDATAGVLYELEQQRATPMTQGIDVNERIHANIDQSSFSQHAGYLETDCPVNIIQLCVRVEKL